MGNFLPKKVDLTEKIRVNLTLCANEVAVPVLETLYFLF